jgi:hypothetical protein
MEKRNPAGYISLPTPEEMAAQMRRQKDIGGVIQSPWRDKYPNLYEAAKMGDEMIGYLPMKRFMGGLGELQSAVLRPDGTMEWLDWGAGMLGQAGQAALGAVDDAAGVGYLTPAVKAGGRLIANSPAGKAVAGELMDPNSYTRQMWADEAGAVTIKGEPTVLEATADDGVIAFHGGETETFHSTPTRGALDVAGYFIWQNATRPRNATTAGGATRLIQARRQRANAGATRRNASLFGTMTGRGLSIRPFTRCWTGRIGVGSGKVTRKPKEGCRDPHNRSRKDCTCGGHNQKNHKSNRNHHSTKMKLQYRDKVLLGQGRESWWEHINTEPPGDLIQIEPRPLQGAGVSGDDILTGDEELPTW